MPFKHRHMYAHQTVGQIQWSLSLKFHYLVYPFLRACPVHWMTCRHMWSTPPGHHVQRCIVPTGRTKGSIVTHTCVYFVWFGVVCVCCVCVCVCVHARRTHQCLDHEDSFHAHVVDKLISIDVVCVWHALQHCIQGDVSTTASYTSTAQTHKHN